MDAVLFSHVGHEFGTSVGSDLAASGWCPSSTRSAAIAAHGAGDPWQGRSALDAVELMDIGMELPARAPASAEQRSHYVIVDGGDQPNVVPSKATVWYYLREIEADGIRKQLRDGCSESAEGAALMTDTKVTRRIVGAACPRHFNRPIALAMDENIRAVGMPEWTGGRPAVCQGSAAS